MFTPLREMARPAISGFLAATLAVTMAPATAYADPEEAQGEAATEDTVATTDDTTDDTATDDDDDDDDRDHRRKHISDRGFIDHHGDDDGRNCRPRTFFRIHQMSPRNFYLPRTRYIDGPGGSMTVTVTREKEITAFLETENERGKDFTHQRDRTIDDRTFTRSLVDHLRRLGLPHLEERHMVFSGHEYTKEITDGMYGNMWYRVFGYRVGWSAWSVLGTCQKKRVGSGLASVPSRVEGWRYWETKHPMFKRRKLSLK